MVPTRKNNFVLSKKGALLQGDSEDMLMADAEDLVEREEFVLSSADLGLATDQVVAKIKELKADFMRRLPSEDWVRATFWKTFGDAEFLGRVVGISADKRFYMVAYDDDGDREELSSDELAALRPRKNLLKAELSKAPKEPVAIPMMRPSLLARKELVGRRVHKEFMNSAKKVKGYFGTVISATGSFYRVMYDDQESEDVSLEEIGNILLPA